MPDHDLKRRAPAARPRWPALAVGALAVGALLVAACGQAAQPDPRPRVVTTTAMIGDVVRHLAGEHLAVASLFGSGVDPHLYRANRDDVARLMRADLVLYNGLHLEGRMGDTLAGLADGTRRVLAYAEPLALETDPGYALLGDPAQGDRALGASNSSAHDPHVWLDPMRWARAAEALAPRLAELVPAASHDIVDIALPGFVASANALVDFGHACFASIPVERRVLVTAHDAFRYLGQRFNLEVVGLQGISTESEAGVRRIEEVVDLLVQRRIPAVFVESSVPDRAVRSLLEGAGARGHAVTIGGELYSDAMGKAGTREGTYVGMVAHDIETITLGLGGRVPGGSFEIWRSVQESARLDDGAWPYGPATLRPGDGGADREVRLTDGDAEVRPGGRER